MECVGGVWEGMGCGVCGRSVRKCVNHGENGQEKKLHLTTLDHMTRYITVCIPHYTATTLLGWPPAILVRKSQRLHAGCTCMAPSGRG